MKLITFLFILLGLIFTGQLGNSEILYNDLDIIPEQYQLPKYNNIAHLPLDVEYEGLKATIMFIINPVDDEYLDVYFLTNNNQELNKVLEIHPYQYGQSEIIGTFVYPIGKSGFKSIYILIKNSQSWGTVYRAWELPLYIEEDGVLRARYFKVDDTVMSNIVCVDDYEAGSNCQFTTQEGFIKHLDEQQKIKEELFESGLIEEFLNRKKK